MFLRIHIDPKYVAVISVDRHELLPVLTDLYKDVMQSLRIEHVKLFFLYRLNKYQNVYFAEGVTHAKDGLDFDNASV